jgi:hypothetical protein
MSKRKRNNQYSTTRISAVVDRSVDNDANKLRHQTTIQASGASFFTFLLNWPECPAEYWEGNDT